SDFDPGNNSFNLISNGGTDVFMALYDSNGNFKGSGSIGGWGNDWVSHIAADNNNIWIAGHYGDPIDMDPDNSSTFILNPKGSSDGFLAKYNLSTVTTTEEMFSNNQVDIYPNPNQGQFSIKSNSQNFSIQIFDVHGKIIKQLENYNNNTVFNIPSVPGIYFLKLKDDNDTIVKKFIVTM
ncbi:MAG: T9SS type A sorting domain-containing protein, partial [Flavobacteriales bacterium]|nr:T9SS type A sorting domain-containing protein [Flavobacteriales bacterium]